MDNITGIRSSSGAIVILPHYLDINAVTRFIDVYIAHQIDNLTIYTCDEPIECIMALNYDELLRCDSSTQRKVIDWQCKNNMPLFRIYSRMIIRSDGERAKVCAKYLDDLIDRMIDCIKDASLASEFVQFPQVKDKLIRNQDTSTVITDLFDAVDHSREVPVCRFLFDVSHRLWPIVGAYCNESAQIEFARIQREFYPDSYPNFASYGHLSLEKLDKFIDAHFSREMKNKLLNRPTSFETGNEYGLLVYGALFFNNWSLAEHLLGKSLAIPYSLCALHRALISYKDTKPDSDYHSIVYGSLELIGFKFDGKVLLPSPILSAYKQMVQSCEKKRKYKHCKIIAGDNFYR